MALDNPAQAPASGTQAQEPAGSDDLSFLDDIPTEVDGGEESEQEASDGSQEQPQDQAAPEDENESDEQAGVPPDLADSVSVKLENGDEVQLSELKAGYLRQDAYTRQRMADTQQVRQAQAQAYDYAAQREGIAAQALVGVMNSIDQLVTPGVTNEYMAQLA
ncbi:MAG: hypothetical protein ACRCWJ_11600, partial [Casimicrobium sp.]